MYNNNMPKISLSLAEKIITCFFEEYAHLGKPTVNHSNSFIEVSVENVKLFDKTAYTYYVLYFDTGCLYVTVKFDGNNLIEPDIGALEALNGYNCESRLWEATVELCDLVLSSYTHIIESEEAFAEILATSFLCIKDSDNEKYLNKLLSYIDN